MNKQNTFITALATGDPDALYELAGKWNVPIPTCGGVDFWCQLSIDLAAHVSQTKPGAWHNDLHDTREDVCRGVNELFFDEGVGDG